MRGDSGVTRSTGRRGQRCLRGRISRFGLLAGVLLLVAGCGSTQDAEDVAEGPTAAQLAQLAQRVEGLIDSDAFRFGDLRGVKLTVDGETVLDRYYESTESSTADVASVGKSIMGTLVGIALDEGELESMDQPLKELLPDYATRMTPDMADVTLAQLLTMTAGLPEDDPDTLPTLRGDFVQNILDQGTSRASGTLAYASVGSHLLSAILSTATGTSTLDYAREKLFDPLGIDTRPASEEAWGPRGPKDPTAAQDARFGWSTDEQGRHLGFGAMWLTLGDMAKLGQLYLDEGRWQGTQVVSEEWVRAATSSQTASDGDMGYGYHWWVKDDPDHPRFAAMGYGGQHIEVVPDLGLVAVFSVRIQDVGPPILEADDWEEVMSLLIIPTLTDPNLR